MLFSILAYITYLTHSLYTFLLRVARDISPYFTPYTVPAKSLVTPLKKFSSVLIVDRPVAPTPAGPAMAGPVLVLKLLYFKLKQNTSKLILTNFLNHPLLCPKSNWKKLEKSIDTKCKSMKS